MFDQNQIKTKNEMQEILHAVSEKLGAVLENEASARIIQERKEAERSAITELLQKMENLSHLKVVIGVPGTQDEQIQRRQRSALMVRDLLTRLDEFPKKGAARVGTSEFPHEVIAAIYYGHLIFSAVEGERRDLAKYLPVSQPAHTPAVPATEVK